MSFTDVRTLLVEPSLTRPADYGSSSSLISIDDELVSHLGPRKSYLPLYASRNFQKRRLSPTPVSSATSVIPAWRRFVVQCDISFLSIPLSFFGFTGLVQNVHKHLLDIGLPAWLGDYCFYLSVLSFVTVLLTYLVRAVLVPSAPFRDVQDVRLRHFVFMLAVVGSLFAQTTPPHLATVGEFDFLFLGLFCWTVGWSVRTYASWFLDEDAFRSSADPLAQLHPISCYTVAGVGARAGRPAAAFALVVLATATWVFVFANLLLHSAARRAARKQGAVPTLVILIGPPAQAVLTGALLSAASLPRSASAAAAGAMATAAAVGAPLPADAAPLGVPPTMTWPPLVEASLILDIFLYAVVAAMWPTFRKGRSGMAVCGYVFPTCAVAIAVMWRAAAPGGAPWRPAAYVLSALAAVCSAGAARGVVGGVYRGEIPSSPADVQELEGQYVAGWD